MLVAFIAVVMPVMPHILSHLFPKTNGPPLRNKDEII